MKKFTVFEASVIGFFIGIIISAYLTFVTTAGGFVGAIISWVSLQPVLTVFNIPSAYTLTVSFIFFVLVYTIYGALIGIIMKLITAPRRVIVPVILILAALVTEQTLGTLQGIPGNQSVSDQTASVISSIIPQHATTKVLPPQQYFAMATTSEASGDLNGDGIADVAFLTYRDDTDRGMLYYLTAALATSTGHTGTNLVFLGDKVKPHDIYIANEMIGIDYTIGVSTSTHQFFAQLLNGVLVATTTASSTI